MIFASHLVDTLCLDLGRFIIGGSPEVINKDTGIVIDKYDYIRIIILMKIKLKKTPRDLT